ncbi:uncharacterized protein LOC115448932 [Manduca sexta]|uniref:uncharacterized protein LOC115448932 n=1 Tax=Manduca sexta TaxID=7130 RepID=UPI00189086F0|nr:uncharacterized protein LOC115448932 [Manduca sexta]
MLVFALALAAAAVGGAAAVSDEEYARFPRLFHLDDYESCLSQPDGLYCLGTFHVTPGIAPNPLYDQMKEYSKDVNNFNRTQLHRGYCVSSRCAGASAEERNSSLRFEQCASRWARRRGLKVGLQRLQYCRSSAQEYARAHNTEPLDLAHRVLTAVVYTLLACNALGTIYDVLLDDDTKKNSLLTVWSLRSNWRRLTATYEDKDPRLSALGPVQGARVFLLTLTMMTHAGVIHVMSYSYNPEFIEKMAHNPNMTLFFNGTSVVQIFLVISSFLLAYNLLILSKDHDISLRHLPFCIIKRIARICPVYLLVVGFAATWWQRVSSGPLWPALVETESAVCRRKFWAQAFFLNNLIDSKEHCLVQTWFIAVDMQLYVVSSVLTLVLVRKRRAALRVLTALAVGACVLNALLAYVFNWQALLYFVNPENLRNLYYDTPSFSGLYMSPWGSLPACLIGLLLAHVHFEMQESGFKLSTVTWFKLPYHLALPLTISWILGGNWARQYTSPEFVAAYVAFERPVFSILCAILLLGGFNQVESILLKFFNWRGWHAAGRMSLSVLMVHWCVDMAFVAARPQPTITSTIEVGMDFVSTMLVSYLIALPLTLMVEMPVQRFISNIMMKVMHRTNK